MRLMAAAIPGDDSIGDDGERFVFSEGDSVAELTYLLQGDELILLHTSVPPRLEGQGIGGRLVSAAVDRAAREGLTIVPWCAFARKWLRGHPEVANTVTIVWATDTESTAT